MTTRQSCASAGMGTGFLSSNVFCGLTGIEFEVHVARALGFACPVLAGLVRLLKVI